MKCIATGDRVFRVFMGIAIIVTGIFFQSWWGAVGLMPFLVGAIGHCPNFGASRRVLLDKERLSTKTAVEGSTRYRAE